MLNALVDRDEYIEIACDAPQQLAILVTAKTRIRDCKNQTICTKMSFQAARDAFIQQNAQLRVPSPVQARQPHALGRRWGNPRGSPKVDGHPQCSPEELEKAHEFRRILAHRPESRDRHVSRGYRRPSRSF